jgi:peptidoglycan hydrolase-like protein with peptidoglycan-binding domain
VTSSKKGKKVNRIHGQRAIDSGRAAEIQTALIRQKYLAGAPTGQWDTQTQVAMRQYQSDHGWQTKLTPDSRALISLGLGPNHSQDPAIGRTSHGTGSSLQQEELTAQAHSAEPGENTLASVHSLSQ